MGIASVPVTRRTEGHLLPILAGIRRTNFAPGVEFSYSNTGYVLAAAITRRVTGMSLREFSAERIFGPLGMADTMWRDDSSKVRPRFAYGHGNDDGVIRRADTEECVVGDGGLATSGADLAHWLGFLADGRVLGAGIRAALLERAVLADGTVHPYALGVYHFTVGGKAAYGHAGSVDGYRSQLLYVPEDGLGFACLANQTRIDPLTLVNRAAGGEADLPAVQAVPGPVPLGHWPARPLGASYLSLKLWQRGITPRASRHSARLALPPTCRHRSSPISPGPASATPPDGPDTPDAIGSTTSRPARRSDCSQGQRGTDGSRQPASEQRAGRWFPRCR